MKNPTLRPFSQARLDAKILFSQEKHDKAIARALVRSQARVRVAAETGLSPFSSEVIRATR